MVSGGYTGPEHHTGIIMDTGTGEGVSWPAGDCTHKSLDFFLRAAAASVE